MALDLKDLEEATLRLLMKQYSADLVPGLTFQQVASALQPMVSSAMPIMYIPIVKQPLTQPKKITPPPASTLRPLPPGASRRIDLEDDAA